MNNLELEGLGADEAKALSTVQNEEEIKQSIANDVKNQVELTDEEKAQLEDFSNRIDFTNSTMIMKYGAASQKKIASFSDSALENVRTKDLGEVGEKLTSLITELKGFEIEEEENKGFFSFFKKQSNKLTSIKAKYNSAEQNVGVICESLENHQIQLMKDIVLLDKLYQMNLDYYKELSMYIIAGKIKLEKERDITLKELQIKAKHSKLPTVVQAANDYATLCDNFEKKLHDLDLTRMVCIQMSPQIRMVQNNDRIMAEKIQSTLVNTIPLWKSQMVLAMGISHSNEALKAQREVSNMTNELLKRNAETLKMGTIETAREAERGIIDIETLKYTNQSLISTLDEVIKISDEGKQKRAQAEKELRLIEDELKNKLLSVSDNTRKGVVSEA